MLRIVMTLALSSLASECIEETSFVAGEEGYTFHRGIETFEVSRETT